MALFDADGGDVYGRCLTRMRAGGWGRTRRGQSSPGPPARCPPWMRSWTRSTPRPPSSCSWRRRLTLGALLR
eukprot:1180423-Prorocentrum_minimum.AAC.1